MKILLVGAGYMGSEYLKVLNKLKIETIVVGKDLENLNALKNKYPENEYHFGGIKKYLKKNAAPKIAINATNIRFMHAINLLLLASGTKKILTEKPGALELNELKELKLASEKNNAVIKIAYNRRFFNSIETLKEKVAEDGGIISTHFEFTEWTHKIRANFYADATLDKWILANSTHVIDTVFHLIGLPKQLNAIVTKSKGLAWHKAGTIFIGSGISKNNIPFSYHSNWESAGRWSIEILTLTNKYYLAPMEELKVQKRGEIKQSNIEIKSEEDLKPGVYNMVSSFINDNNENLCSLDELIDSFPFFNKISNYN